MRILFLSRSTRFDGTSSLSNIPLVVMARMLEADPSVDITWAVPKAASDEQLSLFLRRAVKEENLGRIRFAKVTSSGSDRLTGFSSTEEIFKQLNQATTEYPYDVILNQHMAMAPTYRPLLTNRAMNGRYGVTTPIVNWHLWTATLSQLKKAPEYYLGVSDVAAELFGCAFADMNVWESESLQDDAMASLRTWIQPSSVKKIIENSEQLNVGVDYEGLKETYERRNARKSDGGQPGLIWASRFAAVKKYRVSMEQMESVELLCSKAGKEVDVIVSSGEAAPHDLLEQYRKWKFYERQNRDDWYKVMGGGDVAVCNSVSESYGAIWLEMLAAGIIVVFDDAPWVRSLMPDWYPFIAETKQEQIAMASQLLKSWPDGELWKEYEPRIREWIQQNHNSGLTGNRLVTILQGLVDNSVTEDKGIWANSIGELANTAAEKIAADGEAPLGQIFASMKLEGESDRDWGKKGDQISNMYLRRALQGQGWADQGGFPIIMKKEKK